MSYLVPLVGKGKWNQRTRLSVGEVAEALGFTKWQVRRLVRDGKLRRAFGSGKYGFALDDVNRFLRNFNAGKDHLQVPRSGGQPMA